MSLNFTKALLKFTGALPATNNNNTFEGIIWPQGFVPPSKEDFEKELARTDVPTEVGAGALMRALYTLDMLAQIDNVVAAVNDPLAKTLWARAAAFRRDDPLVSLVGQAAGWSEDDLDDLFRLANSYD